jgi:hypothetical protein
MVPIESVDYEAHGCCREERGTAVCDLYAFYKKQVSGKHATDARKEHSR